MNDEKDKKSKLGKIALLSAVAAGIYFFAGKRGEENRKKVRDTAQRAKKRVSEEFAMHKHISKVAYYRIVEDVLLKFKDRAKNISKSEFEDLKIELERAWEEIKDEHETLEETEEEEEDMRKTNRKSK